MSREMLASILQATINNNLTGPRPAHKWVLDGVSGHYISFYEPQVLMTNCDRSVPLQEILKYDAYVDDSDLSASWELSYKGRLNSWGIWSVTDKLCHRCMFCGCSSAIMGQIDVSNTIPFWVSKGHAATEEREMYRAIKIYIRVEEDYHELYRTKVFFKNNMTKDGILRSLYTITRN